MMQETPSSNPQIFLPLTQIEKILCFHEFNFHEIPTWGGKVGIFDRASPTLNLTIIKNFQYSLILSSFEDLFFQTANRPLWSAPSLA